ncbi:MAG TPA: COX15/CtaA family protein [Gemmatimonadaceae bacterium]|nr:COX15/CtaA family protein [Gemmatimonadaceae bacterium]
MKSLRRLSYITLGLACLHLVFGAIVRISGSGMGCGDNWPKCYGHWFPPFTQPTLVIEWTHRLLAALLITAVVTLATFAFAKRREPGVGGRGGVARTTALAALVVVVTAAFGAVTVFLGNVWYATVVHWLLAATLLAALAAAVIRTGGLGGTSARRQQGTPRAARGATAAAGLALLTVVLGGMTAKIPGANVACQGFPLCSGSLLPALPAQHVQMTHRVLAYLLFFHVLGLVMGMTKRREAPIVLRTVRIAFGLVLLQIVIAATMVELHLPAELRSLHQATGVALWLTLFCLAYLSRIAAGGGARDEGRGAREERDSGVEARDSVAAMGVEVAEARVTRDAGRGTRGPVAAMGVEVAEAAVESESLAEPEWRTSLEPRVEVEERVDPEPHAEIESRTEVRGDEGLGARAESAPTEPALPLHSPPPAPSPKPPAPTMAVIIARGAES